MVGASTIKIPANWGEDDVQIDKPIRVFPRWNYSILATTNEEIIQSMDGNQTHKHYSCIV
jgi:hypothetical protein